MMYAREGTYFKFPSTPPPRGNICIGQPAQILYSAEFNDALKEYLGGTPAYVQSEPYTLQQTVLDCVITSTVTGAMYRESRQIQILDYQQGLYMISYRNHVIAPSGIGAYTIQCATSADTCPVLGSDGYADSSAISSRS